MRNKLWNIWCHSVVACYGMTVVLPRLPVPACLVGAFVVIALMEVPETNSVQRTVAGGPFNASELAATFMGLRAGCNLSCPNCQVRRI